MGATITLTDDVISFPLIYNASTQPAYRLQYGGRLQIPQTTTIEHQPDTSAPLPVLGWDSDRSYFFTLDTGSNVATNQYACQGWDDPLNAQVAIKRMVDGANQQALRYWTDCDVRQVFLDVTLEGATTKTRTSVKLGLIDDGASYYDSTSKSEVALDVVVGLRVEPYGQGETFTLSNALGGAPAMLEGTTLATGLTGIGAPTFTLDNDIYVMGGQAQKVVTDAVTTQGFETANVTLAGVTDVVAFVWLYIEAGGDDISVALVTDVGTVGTSILTPDDDNEVSDMTAVDSQGNTWYRVPISGTTLPALTVKLVVQRILSPSIATTFYADMLYIALNETTIPLGWAGDGKSMQNSGNATSNKLDVSGIAGDMDAIVNHKITIVSASLASTRNFTASRAIDGVYLAADKVHWQSASLWTGATGAGVWSGTTTKTYTSAAGGEVATATVTVSGEDARKFLSTTRRVFGRLSTDTAAVEYQFSVNTPDGIFNGAANDVNVVSQFELVDLGLMNGIGALPENPPDPLKPDMTFTITVSGFTAGGQTASFEGFFFLYADDDFMLGQTLENTGSGDDLWLLGDVEQVVTEVRGQYEPRILGTSWTLATGTTSNRLVYTFAEIDNLHINTGVFDVVLEVTPRTRHLLGTM